MYLDVYAYSNKTYKGTHFIQSDSVIVILFQIVNVGNLHHTSQYFSNEGNLPEET